MTYVKIELNAAEEMDLDAIRGAIPRTVYVKAALSERMLRAHVHWRLAKPITFLRSR